MVIVSLHSNSIPKTASLLLLHSAHYFICVCLLSPPSSERPLSHSPNQITCTLLCPPYGAPMTPLSLFSLFFPHSCSYFSICFHRWGLELGAANEKEHLMFAFLGLNYHTKHDFFPQPSVYLKILWFHFSLRIFLSVMTIMFLLSICRLKNF